LYRSPSIGNDDVHKNGFKDLSDKINSLLRIYPDTEFVIAGDFNIYNKKWLVHSPKDTREGLDVEFFASSYNLTQLISEPTRIPRRENEGSYLLDLFLTSSPEKYSTRVFAPLGSSDHCVVTASFRINQSEKAKAAPKRQIWHYKKAKWADFNAFLNSFDWSLNSYDKNVNTATNVITNTILLGMKLFIPSSVKSVSRNKKKSSWMNVICRKAINDKDEAFKNYRTNRSEESRKIYNTVRNKCKTIVKTQRFLHDQKLKKKILDLPANDRSFWSFAKSVKNNFCDSSYPPLISENTDTLLSDSQEKADLFAKLFSKNATLSSSNLSPPQIPSVHHEMPKLYFRTRAVHKILLNLDVNKSTGPDGIPAVVLKNIASSIAKPLRNLFHLSFLSGTFPELWKVSNVTAIPKKGNKSNPSNYRPIAIASILSKIMETVLNRKLMKYLETKGLISDRQYGFRPNRSTGDLMTYISHKLSATLHDEGEACAVALDISKAFDRVWHSALVSKCQAFGLGNYFCRWIENFLQGRSIQVLVDGFTSSLYTINAGVPQGCVLSSTLFLIFINDFLSLTTNPIYSYADDSTLIASYTKRKTTLATQRTVALNREKITRTVNKDLSLIEKWGQENRVQFNAAKTQCCLFSRKLDASTVNLPIKFQEIDIELSSELYTLGTLLSSKLIWNDHVFKIAKNATKCLGFLRRCKSYFTPKDLLKIYKAYIRPKMEYNSHIWAGASTTTLDFLDKVQDRAIRLINDENVTTSLAPLGHRRNIGALCLLYKYFVGNDTCSREIKSILPELKTFSRVTRLATNSHPYFIYLKINTTSYFENSYIARSSKIWNLLPENVFPKIGDTHVYNLQKFKTNINKVTHNLAKYPTLIPYFPYPN